MPTKLGVSLRGQVEETVRLCVQLRSHIDDCASSLDFEVFAPHERHEFSHELMITVDTISFKYGRDADPPEGKMESSSVVLCTTALGLRRRDNGRATVKARVVQEVLY